MVSDYAKSQWASTMFNGLRYNLHIFYLAAAGDDWIVSYSIGYEDAQYSRATDLETREPMLYSICKTWWRFYKESIPLHEYLKFMA